ncbi:MAG TPA: hypothetical protein PLZ08_11295 [Bacillota bacterium]|nr:hypothetical protein [Bacillota bacterium]HPO98523.1 hypothetical protein [Bacillota bacterium]
MAKSKEILWNIVIVFSIAATFMGTVVGAGFASGQEILQFFCRYGLSGVFGIALSVVIISIITAKIFKIGKILRSDSYKDFLGWLLPKRLVLLADLFLVVFFVLLIGVMFAGSGAIFKELHLGYWNGIIITAVVLIIVLNKDLPGLMVMNLLVIPLMFTSSLLVACFAISRGTVTAVSLPSPANWAMAAAQFSSYNIILAVPVLLSLAKRFRKEALLTAGGWFGGIFLGIMTGFIYWAIIVHYDRLQQSEIPMLILARRIGAISYWGYAFILWGEMLTTLIANTYGLAKRFAASTGYQFQYWVIGLSIVGILVAELGFTTLIAKIYPIYGCLSMVLLVLVLIKRIPKSFP